MLLNTFDSDAYEFRIREVLPVPMGCREECLGMIPGVKLSHVYGLNDCLRFGVVSS